MYLPKDPYLEYVKNSQNSMINNPSNSIRKCTKDMKNYLT